MSRIGKLPISLPQGVSVKLNDDRIEVKGPKGTLGGSVPAGISASLEGNVLRFERPDEKRESRALHGLARALAKNMVIGVTQGFAKALEIQGVGYRAEVKGQKLVLALGFSHPVEMDVPKGLSVTMDGNTKLRVEGPDKRR